MSPQHSGKLKQIYTVKKKKLPSNYILQNLNATWLEKDVQDNKI